MEEETKMLSLRKQLHFLNLRTCDSIYQEEKVFQCLNNHYSYALADA